MPPEHAREEHSLAKWQLVLIVAIVAAVALVLAGYGAAGSYDSLWHLAVKHHVPLPRLNPVGLDGGLLGVLVLDIALTWSGHPLGWLRAVARLFAAGTVAANAAAGWPDPVGVFLRVFAPLLIVVISEAIRAVLLGKAGDRDAIPAARWVLAPWPTFVLWRRTKLWRITSYSAAVDMELSRRKAIIQLRSHYAGNDWRKAAPGDVVWMLRRGVRMDDALARVAELTAPPPPEPEAEVPARKRAASSGRKRTRKPARGAGRRTAVSSGAEADTEDVSTEAQAIAIIAAEPGISGSELGRRLGKTDRYGRELIKRLTVPAKEG